MPTAKTDTDDILKTLEHTFGNNADRINKQLALAANDSERIVLDKKLKDTITTDLTNIIKSHGQKVHTVSITPITIAKIRASSKQRRNTLLIVKKSLLATLLVRHVDRKHVTVFLQMGMFSVLTPSESIRNKSDV